MSAAGDSSASPDSSDEALMVAYQNGSETAFARLYEKHSSRVYGYLLSHLRERSLAEDAFQASFLRLHASRAKYDPRLPFAPWLFTICRSAAMDALRARKRAQDHEAHDDRAIAAAPAPAPVPAPVPATGELGSPDLSRLPARQREALELRYGQDLPFEEISKRLNVTPTHSRQLVSRALRKLRALVREEAAQEGTK